MKTRDIIGLLIIRQTLNPEEALENYLKQRDLEKKALKNNLEQTKKDYQKHIAQPTHIKRSEPPHDSSHDHASRLSAGSRRHR